MPAPVVNMFDARDYEGQILHAADLLKQGKIVVLPTETVYGAAGLLKQPAALDRLKSLRPGTDGKPLTVHLADRKDAEKFIGPLNAFGRRMTRKLWPGPVGLMFDVPPDRRAQVAPEQGVPESDLYADGTITLRCPDHVVAIDVIGETGGTVVAVRAGVGSNQPALRGDQVAAELDDKVDLILDAGPTRYNRPSTIVKVKPDSYEIVRAGVYDERIIERLLRTTILFVCSGNTCRSPMAEAIARRVMAEKLGVPESELEKKGITIISAGSVAMPGSRATPQAVEALKDLGADLSRHRSRPLTIEVIHQADVIYTMGRAHAMAVMALVPSAADKVTTLSPEGEIDDPIGSDIGVYRELAGELQTLIENRLKEEQLQSVL